CPYTTLFRSMPHAEGVRLDLILHVAFHIQTADDIINVLFIFIPNITVHLNMLIAVEILIEFSLVREERYNFMQLLNIFRSVFILPAVDCNTAFMDWDETDDRIEQRRLSGPVRRNQSDDRPVFYIKVHFA